MSSLTRPKSIKIEPELPRATTSRYFISLKSWYDRYKEKPRTCQREVNQLVRKQIQSMMLDIRDLDHYKEIDFIRTSVFGETFADTLGKNPEILPEKLEADKELVRRLAAVEPDYGAVETYRKALEEARFEDRQVVSSPSWVKILLNILLLLLTLPLAVFCLWPYLPNWFIPQYANDHLKDDDGMFLTSLFRWSLSSPGFSLVWQLGASSAWRTPFPCHFCVS